MQYIVQHYSRYKTLSREFDGQNPAKLKISHELDQDLCWTVSYISRICLVIAMSFGKRLLLSLYYCRIFATNMPVIFKYQHMQSTTQLCRLCAISPSRRSLHCKIQNKLHNIPLAHAFSCNH